MPNAAPIPPDAPAPEPRPSAVARRPGLADRLLRALRWAAFGVFCIAAAGYLAMRYWLWPGLDGWRPEIEARLTEALGAQVSIGSIETGFDGLAPRLVARVVEVSALPAAGREAGALPGLRIESAEAVLSLRTFVTGEPRLASLDVRRPELVAVRTAPRRVEIAGLVFDLDAPGDGGGLDRLLAQRRIVLHDAQVQWIDRVEGTSWRADRVGIAVGSVGRRHRASIRIPSVPGVAAGVVAAAEFYRPPRTRASDWRQWHGEAYAGAEGVALGPLQRELRSLRVLAAESPPSEDRRSRTPDFDGGIAAGRAWLRFEAGGVVDGRLKLLADEVAASLDGRPLPLHALGLEAEASRRDDGGVLLRFPRIEARDGSGLSLATAEGEQRLVLDASLSPVAGRFSFERFESARLVDLVRRLPLPPDLGERFAPLRVSGAISKLAIEWEAPRGELASFRVETAFDRLGVTRAEAPPRPGEMKMPSFANVSGTASITERGGRMAISGESAVFRFPGLFADPSVALSRVDAKVGWTMGEVDPQSGVREVKVEVEDFRFANADAAGSVTGTYRTGGQGPGIVDLDGRLGRVKADRVARYLPLQISETVRDWVGRSVTAGLVEDARFRLRGDLWDFPYREPGSGEFRIEARLKDATLAYAPGWPPIDRIQGRLVFERAGMDIAADSGQVYGVRLSGIQARVAEFNEPLLVIEGAGEGPAQDLVRFVNESALGTRIDDFTRDVAARGDARLQLRLEMPLHDMGSTRVAGAVTLRGNDVVLDRTLPEFGRASGRLEFSERGFALRGIAATFLGGPIRVEGETVEPGRMQVRANGTVSADALRALEDSPLTRRLSGSTDWRASIDVRGRGSAITLESDLVGLASGLPPPFAKTAAAAWPLRIESAPARTADPDARPAKDVLRARLRDDVRVVFERERDPGTQKLLVRRGSFALNAEPILQESGFSVVMAVPEIDFDAWSSVLREADAGASGAQPAPGPEGGFSLLPNFVSVVAERLHVADKDINDVVLGASRFGGFWRANLSSREINGFFNWRAAQPGQPMGTLTARFTRLEIPRSRASDFESLLESTPGALPALDVEADEFVLLDHSLGRLKLRATNSGSAAAPVWTLQQLSVSNPAATLEATGAWQTRRGAPERSTALDFDLELRDAGALLATFGLPDVLRGGAGKLAGSLGWIGSPIALDYPSLGGQMRLDVGRGQFLKTEPGIAKLIGVLNLQSLPRRLTLDFRDVFAEGFAFDAISGDVRIERGIARTDDFRMRGVQAQVVIAGQADIAAETQQLKVEVRPELNAGLASLAYAAVANPALGLGAFVAQMALRKPLQQIFTYEYEVSGSWDDPHVTEKVRPQVAPTGPQVIQ